MIKNGRWLIALLLCMMLLTGCGRTPGQQPQEKQKQMSEPEISVYFHETGETRKMRLEEYIEGVVGGEMKNDWPVEALAAQAIMARTFTMQSYEAGSLTSEGTNASTDIREFQAYRAENVNDNIREAVKMTRGEIAVYNGEPIMAWFHASAGGQTSSAREGLDYPYEEPPYIKMVKSPDGMAPADIASWQAEFTLPEVMQALSAMGEEVNSISSVAVGSRGISGRAATLIFNGDIQVSGPRLRLALGSTKLKSMLLDTIEINDKVMIFKGRGYGHGVGLSQWGAYQLAEDGRSPEEIVRYYFKNIKVEKRWQ